MSVFADFGPKYFESGYNIFPVFGKGLPAESGHNNFWQEKMPEATFERLSKKFPDANIGLLTGKASQVVAFDFDYSEPNYKELEELILNIIPPSPVTKFGKKGWTKFYKFNPDVDGTNYKYNKLSKDKLGKDKMDSSIAWELISNGRYTIIPPSIHPDTKRPYIWNGERALEDVTPDELPMITTSDFHELKKICDIYFGKVKTPMGRNQAIWAYAYKLSKECDSKTEWVSKVFDYDLKKFGENSWFADKTENKGRSPEAFAMYMANSWHKSIIRIHKQRQGIDWDFGVKIEEPELFAETQYFEQIAQKYSHFENGFLKTIINEQGEKHVPQYQEFSRFAIDVLGLKVYKEKYIFIWSDGRYESIEKMQLKKIIAEHVFDWATPNYIENFYKRIYIDAQIIGDIPQNPPGIINFGESVYDFKTDKVLDKSKDRFFTYKLDIKYDPTAKCPKYLAFLDDVFSGDAELIEATQRILGYILLGDEQFLQKAFVLFGTGRNGKGVYLKVLKMILGECYSVVSMSKLGSGFAIVNLDGALANIAEETPSEINSEVFKSITGDGEIQAGQKNKPEYRFKVKCKFIFACNDFPRFEDKNISLNDRLFIIPFNKTYEEGINRDPMLFEKIQHESSGILSWAIKGAKKVMTERIIVAPQASKDMKRAFREENDQVFSWFNECLKLEGIEGKFIATNQLYVYYRNWSDESGHRQMSKMQFSKRLSRLISEMSHGVDRSCRSWVGTSKVRGYSCLTGKCDSALGNHVGEFLSKSPFVPVQDQ